MNNQQLLEQIGTIIREEVRIAVKEEVRIAIEESEKRIKLHIDEAITNSILAMQNYTDKAVKELKNELENHTHELTLTAKQYKS